MHIFLKLIFLSFFILSSLFVFGQNDLKQHYEGDVIYFKGGGKLYGKILTIKKDTIKFEMITNKVINIETGTIKKIIQKFDKHGRAKLKFYSKKPYEFKEQGIYHSTYINLPQGRHSKRYNDIFYSNYYYDDWLVGMGIHHVSGLQHNRWLGTGAGIGFDGYDLGYNKNILSVYGECRGYLMKKKFSPFYSVGLGYGFAFSNTNLGILESKGGLFFNQSLGYRFGGSSGANFVMNLGYKLQIAKYTERQNLGPILIHKTIFSRLNAGFGVLF